MKIIEIIFDKECRLKPTQQQMQDLLESIKKLDKGGELKIPFFFYLPNSLRVLVQPFLRLL